MSAHQSEWFRPRVTRPAGERRFRLLAVGAAILFLAYLAATLAGAPRQASSLIFSVAVFPVPFLGWWAYMRAPANLRRTWLFGAWAATLWLAGSLVWYAFFLADGSVVPTPPGVWDFFFAGAQLCLIMAVVVSMRSFALARIAAADTAVIASAGIALGAAFISRGLEGQVSAATITTLNRPLLGIVTLMLIAAAALASWDGIPSSLVLLGLGEVGLIVGDLVYSYAAVQGHYDNDRWANLGWSAGAAGAMLAASTIILGIDRPLRLPVRHRVPGHPVGSRAALLVNLIAIMLTLGVATYGLMGDRRDVALIGIVASLVIAIAMVARARDSLRTAEQRGRTARRCRPRIRASPRRTPRRERAAPEGERGPARHAACGRTGVQPHRREDARTAQGGCRAGRRRSRGARRRDPSTDGSRSRCRVLAELRRPSRYGNIRS